MLSFDSQSTIRVRTWIASIWANSRNRNTICNRSHRQRDHFSCMRTFRVCRHRCHHISFAAHNRCHWTPHLLRIDKVWEWGCDVPFRFSLHGKCRKYSHFLATHESRPNRGTGIAVVCTQNRSATASNRRWPPRMHDPDRIPVSPKHSCDRRDSTCDISGSRTDWERRPLRCMESFLRSRLDCTVPSHSSIL